MPDLKFELHNRGVDQPYKIVGTWLIDQWKQVGVKVTQQVQPTGPFYDTLRKKKDFDVSIDFNCQAVVNPLLDVAKFLSDDKSGNQYGGYKDRGAGQDVRRDEPGSRSEEAARDHAQVREARARRAGATR